MHLIDLCVRRPVAVLAGVLIVMLLGWLSLTSIPIQLTPDVRKPLIIVETDWRGGSPSEIEREIVNRQEEALKGLEGLERMESRSRRGSAQILLTFVPSASREQSILLINNRLSQISGTPEEADEPKIITRDTDDNPIAWFTVRPKPGNTRSVFTYGDFVEDVVRDRLERVSGIAVVNVFGGDEFELRVIVDPRSLAHYGITAANLVDALRGTNINVAAGEVDEGKRQYTVRTESELNSLERVKSVVLRSIHDETTGRVSRVTVGDIATVEFGHKRASARIRTMGENAIVVNAIRDTGANVIDVMKNLRATAEKLNSGPLAENGLILEQVYDDTLYIHSSIDLVTQNIWVGGLLAAIILMLFLRSFGATLSVSLAIPVSIVGSFVAMAALGRSLNVISLAGIAFAVGMVVDAAIVVLENIFRHRELGRGPVEAAIRGAKEVWGAIMASAVTTVVVFTPILVMDLVVGQLFRDIAVALSVAVLLSLIVSITVVPSLAARLVGGSSLDAASRARIPLIDGFAGMFVGFITGFTRKVIGNRLIALGVVGAVCGVTLLFTWLFLPKLEYLPEGNRNLVIALTLPPPGYNLETTQEIARDIENATRSFWAKNKDDVGRRDEPVKIERLWFVARSTTTIIAASATDPTRAAELIPILQRSVFSEPGTFGFVAQTSLFGRGFGGSRVIDLDITGPNLEDILEIAREGVRVLNREMPRSGGTQIRPQPGLGLGAPEVRVVPDLRRLADNGLSARDLGVTIDVFNDGMRVSEVTVGAKRIDLTLMGTERNVTNTQGIASLPVVTRSGRILPVNNLASVSVTEGPNQIQHLERQRTVTLQIRPAPDIALETAIDIVRAKVIEPMREAGLPQGVAMSLSGSADELQNTWQAMITNLLIAMLVVYLVMAILFESFIYPLIIMFSVPLATAGGVAGLVLLNLFTKQSLDMLTMLGFVILIGTVVNNAILLVHQTLFHIRNEGTEVADAIVEATRNRIRPIFMSTLTSVFGMLPLVVTPGAGSELYRGLGSVVVGGLALSAVLTLLIIPPLLSVASGLLERERGKFTPGTAMEPPPVAAE
jgi:hydrophobic/amphiphilic exporter-1 (mainly G- bacteria), HAE1 family